MHSVSAERALRYHGSVERTERNLYGCTVRKLSCLPGRKLQRFSSARRHTLLGSYRPYMPRRCPSPAAGERRLGAVQRLGVPLPLVEPTAGLDRLVSLRAETSQLDQHQRWGERIQALHQVRLPRQRIGHSGAVRHDHQGLLEHGRDFACQATTHHLSKSGCSALERLLARHQVLLKADLLLLLALLGVC